LALDGFLTRGAAMTQHDHDEPDRCTTGERCRGVLELSIIVGVITLVLSWPSLLMFPVLAAACGLLVMLAVWDDAARRRANEKTAAARERAEVACCGQDRLTPSGGDKRAA
jgi:hypothetical protein